MKADVEFLAVIDDGPGERLVQADQQTISAGSSVPTSSVWRDRVSYVVGAALVVIAGIAWAGVVRQSTDMQPGMTSDADIVSLPAALVFLAAWGVMMAVMMLPSATPMIVMYDKISRGLDQRDRVIPTALFAAIYLSIWLGLGVVVYVAGVGLNLLAASNPNVTSRLPYLLAAVLVATGVYQFTPLKRACLRNCRTPVGFVMGRWQAGYRGRQWQEQRALRSLRLATLRTNFCVAD